MPSPICFIMNKEHKLKYNDPYSLLIVSSNGKIRKIFTPFEVICKDPISGIESGEIVVVEMIIEQPLLLAGFDIRGIYFYIREMKIQHSYFSIP